MHPPWESEYQGFEVYPELGSKVEKYNFGGHLCLLLRLPDRQRRTHCEFHRPTPRPRAQILDPIHQIPEILLGHRFTESEDIPILENRSNDP